MDRVRNIVNSFWNHFEEPLNSGVPVYFNFTEALIKDLVLGCTDVRTGSEALEIFLDSARSFLAVNGSIVEIDETIYRLDQGKSSSIILIAFLIYAAEKMIKTENFTEAAYFPPLRELISPDLEPRGLLPFRQDEFNKLWRVFRAEALSYSGDETVITFDYVRNDAFKNKIFPLSQALLNQEDLICLSLIYHETSQKYRYGNNFDWRSFLISNARKLSKRGLKCLLNESLREELVNQVKSFLDTFDKESIVAIDTKMKNLRTSFEVVVEEDEDFFSGSFGYKLSYIYEGLELDPLVGKDRLLKFLESKEYITVYRDRGAFFGAPRKNYSDYISNLGFIATGDEFKKYVESSVNKGRLEFGKEVFENDDGLFFYYIKNKEHESLELAVKLGVLSVGATRDLIEFEGGIPVDLRGYVFFADYPPKIIKFNGKALTEDQKVYLDGNELSVKSFMEIIQSGDEKGYSLRIEDKTILLEMRKALRKEKSKVGYRIKENILSLFTSLLGDEEVAVVGPNIVNHRDGVKITKGDFVRFLTRDKDFLQPVPEPLIELLVNSIRTSKKLSKTQKNYLISYVKFSKKAPPRVLERLEVA